MLENVVYLELLRRSGNVMVGQHDGREVDFVTRDGDDIRYYQVAETVRDETTRTREYAPLLAIRDHYPKTLVTLDMDLPASNNGVRQTSQRLRFPIGGGVAGILSEDRHAYRMWQGRHGLAARAGAPLPHRIFMRIFPAHLNCQPQSPLDVSGAETFCCWDFFRRIIVV